MIKKVVRWLLLLGFGILLIQRIFFFKQSFLENAAATLLYPFLQAAHKIAVITQHHTDKTRNHQSLVIAYKKLEQEYNQLLTSYVTSQASAHFYDTIKEILDFKQRYHFDQAVIGKVILRTLNDLEQTYLVNRGSQDGIKPDMVAIYKLQIIGKVTTVYPHYCKIMLITDKRCKIAGFTNTSNAGGISVGMNKNNRCDFLYVSHLSQVQDEDLIFSSGQGLIFPEGFCLGKIVSHQLKEKELYHTIEIEPLVNLAELETCLIADQSKIVLF